VLAVVVDADDDVAAQHHHRRHVPDEFPLVVQLGKIERLFVVERRVLGLLGQELRKLLGVDDALGQGCDDGPPVGPGRTRR
jgi:hypothetical protein